MQATLDLIQIYRSSGLADVVDYHKFNHFAITHHSTNLEGSTLTATETQLLLDEGLTPKGKPLQHSLMVKDHYDALRFVLQEGQQKAALRPELIKAINGRVLKNTGAIYYTALGDVDSSKGEYRRSNVRVGNRYFVNYAKIPALVEALCHKLEQACLAADTTEKQLLLSFDAHFDLVSIHPFYNGNGRTARLLMNFFQSYFDLPLAMVFAEDKVDYFEALEQSRLEESLAPFRNFMLSQYQQHLREEIERYRRSQDLPKPGGGFSLVF
jgi:Fic family protein